ncbi:MAG: MFS transporter [Comamonadaceae bacterium]|jgi:MFS family permease|nr:MFS transporter [Comamonadaceae bacterium]
MNAAPSQRWAVACLGTTQTLAWASSYYLPAMLATPMARDLGVSTPTVFAAFSLALVVSALLGPLAGHAIDRHGGRPVLLATNMVFALALAALALAQGPVTLFAAWALMGIAMAHPLGALLLVTLGGPAAAVFTALHGAGNGILTIAKGTLPLALFGPAGYGMRQGWLMAPARVAQAFAPLLFGLLLDRAGASAILLTGALGLTVVLALWALKRSPP